MIPATPHQPHRKLALTLAALTHVLLLLFLFLGVQWKRNAPEVMEVELWSARPQMAQVAPPPPPAPEPPRPEVKSAPEPMPKLDKQPDIAVAKEKKKPEPEKKKAPEPPPPELKKPEPKKNAPTKPATPDFSRQLEQEQQDRQRDRWAKEAAQEQKASAAQRGLAKWVDKIRIKVRGNLFMPPNLRGNPAAVFLVTQLPTGEILDVKLRRSSGNALWDSAVERAIQKSSPLPRPDDGSVFERELELTLCPNEQGCR